MPVAEEKTVNVYFAMNQDMGEFTENPEAERDVYKRQLPAQEIGDFLQEMRKLCS